MGWILGMGQDGEMSKSSTFGDASAARLTPQDFLDYLDAATQRFAGLVDTGDLEVPVPSCPDWTFADLVAHLGEVHQWATHAIVTGNPNAQPIPAPSERTALVEWYRDAAVALLSALRTTDPLAPAWAFGPKPRTASFWFRRQAHETTIHLWDAATSQSAKMTSKGGGSTSQATPMTSQSSIQTFDNALALDGIDEVASMFFPRQVRLGRIPRLERTLALEPTGSVELGETGGSSRWVLAGDGTGPASTPDAGAEATIAGPAEQLLLMLWGRTGLDDVRLMISGDETAARAVLNAGITP